MKRILGGLLAGALIVVALSGTALAKQDKVYVCHAAGRDGTTQYVTLHVPATESGFPQGHFTEDGTPEAGHEADYLGPCEPEVTPSPDPTETPEPSSEPTPTPVPSATPTATPEPSSTPTFTPSPTPSVEPTPTPTPSATPTSTPTPSPSPTLTPTPSGTPEPSPSFTSSPPPIPTLPPTDTETSGSSTGSDPGMVGWLVLALAAAIGLYAMTRRLKTVK